MKKITKKTAALTAAVMALTAISSMGVYAEFPTVITENDEKTVTLPFILSIEEKETGTKVPNYVGSDKNDDSSKRIWNICVETYDWECTLEWTAAMDTTQDYTVQWDPENQKYVRKYNGEGKVVKDIKKHRSFGENVFINRSNFSVDWTCDFSNPSTLYDTLVDNGIEFTGHFYGYRENNNSVVQEKEDIPITNKTMSSGGTLITKYPGNDIFAHIEVNLNDTLSSEQMQNIYKAYLEASTDEEEMRLFDLVMSFTPSSEPIPFEEGGEYDTGNLPE